MLALIELFIILKTRTCKLLNGMGIGRKVNVWMIVFGYVHTANFLAKQLQLLSYISTVQIMGQGWTVKQNDNYRMYD